MRKVAFEKQYIPELTDKTFPIETKEKDLLVVLFYLTCKQHLVLSEISIMYQEIYFARMNKFVFTNDRNTVLIVVIIDFDLLSMFSLTFEKPRIA